MQARLVGSAAAVVRDVRVTLPRLQERVAVSAANKATKKVHTQTVRDISREVGIPQQILRGSSKRGVKGRVKHYKYSRVKGRARVWTGLGKIPLRKVFKGRRVAGGVAKFQRYASGSLKGRSAAEAFSARMPGGREGIYVRKPGSDRLPIQEVALDIRDIGETIVRRNGRVIGGPAFEKEYERDMKRRLART